MELRKRSREIYLVSSIEEGDMNALKELIKCNGKAFMEKWDEGYTLLYNSIILNRREIARHLILNGCICSPAVSTVKQTTPLHLSVEKGDVEIVNMLLERKVHVDVLDKKKKRPLHIAVEKGFVEIAKSLLDSGAKLTYKYTTNYGKDYTIPYLAIITGIKRMIELFKDKINLKLRTGKNPLQIAFENNNVEAVKELVKLGADVNIEYINDSGVKHSLLYNALEKNNFEVCLLIIKQVRNVRAEGPEDLTVLHVAIDKGFAQVVEHLLNLLFSTPSYKGPEKSKSSPPQVDAKFYEDEEKLQAYLNYAKEKNASDKILGLFDAISSERSSYLDMFKMEISSDKEEEEEEENDDDDDDDDNDDNQSSKDSSDYDSYPHRNNYCGYRSRYRFRDYFSDDYTSSDDYYNRDDWVDLSLLYAIRNDDNVAAKAAINGGFDVNFKNLSGTPLTHIAIQKRNSYILRYLLDHGASLTNRNRNGKIALEYAIELIRGKCLRMLLDYKNYTDRYQFIYDYITGDDRHYPSDCKQSILGESLEDAFLSHLFDRFTIDQLYDQTYDPRFRFVHDLISKIEDMKNHRVGKSKITFYDCFKALKDTHQLAVYLKDVNVKKTIESCTKWHSKVPLFQNSIRKAFIEAKKRRSLLDKLKSHLGDNNIGLGDCIDKILSYLNDNDLQAFINAYK